MFDSHGLTRDGVTSLMKDPSMAFVALERDVGNEYCSYLRAITRDGPGTAAGGFYNNPPAMDCDDVPREFVVAHDKWFDRIRQELRLNGRSFVDVPFSLVASCGLPELAESILVVNGFVLPTELELPSDIVSFFPECVEAGVGLDEES